MRNASKSRAETVRDATKTYEASLDAAARGRAEELREATREQDEALYAATVDYETALRAAQSAPPSLDRAEAPAGAIGPGHAEASPSTENGQHDSIPTDGKITPP
jgi:hypothetical protein